MTSIAMTYRQHLVPFIAHAADQGLVTAVEVVPSGYLTRHAAPLLQRRLAELGLPYTFHFTHSSVASADFPTNHRCDATREFLESFNPLLVSDHLTCARAGDLDLEMNLPILATEPALEIYIENVRHFADRLESRVPLLLEQVPDYYAFKASTMSYGELYARTIHATDVGVLLDLHNLYCDEQNGGERAEDFIARLPPNKILEVHVAGGHALPEDGGYIDSHAHALPERVFELLEHTLTLCTPRLIVLEREARFRDLDALLRDLERLNHIAAAKRM
ncbi:DUF692 domain-containing protein [Hyalangium versicolor]|uniref:DUF692 domain-containing protein n=1 Tax=Hyalangium versicolor TaxID=2861190 RepID=UPI001CC9331C|nr:DUF692 family multinuclear iron-containing protein [Hyalangium versicolor]